MYHVTWAHCCARFTIHIPLTKKNSSSSSLFSSISQADAEAARTSVCLVSVPSLFQCLYISSPDLISRCQSTFSSFVLLTRKTLFSILQQSSHISACTHSYHFFICHHRYHAAPPRTYQLYSHSLLRFPLHSLTVIRWSFRSWYS